MPVAAIATTAIVAPTALSGVITGNIIVAQHGSKIERFWWENMYQAKSERVLFTEDRQEKFRYMLVNIAMILEKEGKNDHTRRIHLDSSILYLLSHPDCPYHSDFFDQHGRKKRDHILFPTRIFYLKSTSHPNKHQNQAWTRLRCHPLTDGVNVIGIDFWTWQWFWGIGANQLNPTEAKKAMFTTIDAFHYFDGMNERLRIIAMATGKILPLSTEDRQSIQDYNKFVHQIINPDLITNEITSSDPITIGPASRLARTTPVGSPSDIPLTTP